MTIISARAESKARNRDALLAAAADLIAERGVRGTSVNEIARRAGMTSGAVYSIFGSQHALLLELLITVPAELNPAVLERHDRPLDEVLADFGRAFAEAAAGPGWNWRVAISLELITVALHDEELLEAFRTRSVVTSHTEIAERLRRREEATGEPLPVDADLLAEVLLGTIEGMAIRTWLSKKQLEPEVFASAAAALAHMPPRAPRRRRRR